MKKILIYEYAERGSFDNYLRPPNNDTSPLTWKCPLTWKQRMVICIDAARGLDYLHNPVVGNQRVIHRDIKSANILIDQHWKAMIADLGLSKLGRANEDVTFLITNAVGTIAYVDPAYVSGGILTKDSDVYSFGVVLFEALCGYLFAMDVPGKKRLTGGLARQYYEQGKLDLIIDPDLKKDTEYVKEFSEIAYQCLDAEQKRRPSMDVVLQKLQKALELFEIEEALRLRKLEETYELPVRKFLEALILQELLEGFKLEEFEKACKLKELQEAKRLQEYEDACELQQLEEALDLQKLVETLQVPVIVEAFLLQELDDAMEMQVIVETLEFHKLGELLELETDYAVLKVIHMMLATRLKYTNKEEIYIRLSSGILVDDGKTWFSIDEYGHNQEMISAMKFMPQDPNICDLISGYGSRRTRVFPMVAKILKASEVNTHVNIRTQFLSPNVSYAAYLVCKHEHDALMIKSVIHSVKYKLNNRSQSYSSRPLYSYNNEWVMMELFQLNSLKRRVEFEVLLEKFLFYRTDEVSTDELIVQGIVFLPIQKFDEKLRAEEMKSPPGFETGWENRLPSDYENLVYYSDKMMKEKDRIIMKTKEEAYAILSNGVYIKMISSFWGDPIEVWFWISQSNGKKCFMLSALTITKCGVIIESNESRFKYVITQPYTYAPKFSAALPIPRPLLSPNTSYACYLVYKIDQAYNRPVHVRTVHRNTEGEGVNREEHNVDLYLSRPKSPLVIGPNIAEGCTSTINKHSIIQLPSKRKDGWLEVMLWKSTNEPTTLYKRLIQNSSDWIYSHIPCFSLYDDDSFRDIGFWTIYRLHVKVARRTEFSEINDEHRFEVYFSCSDHKGNPITWFPNITLQGIEIREL